MPLLDHFRPPIHPDYPWETFHATWATEIMAYLNKILPSRYLATVQVHLGRHVEADVAEFERQQVFEHEVNGPDNLAGTGGVAVATWAPPAVTTTLRAVFPDDLEVRVIDRRGDYRLVAVVELVSPGNKDRPEERQAFSAKCAAYLQRGVGLIVIDSVTTRQGNLYAELGELLSQPGAPGLPEGAWLHAAAYRPIRRQETNQIDVWLSPLAQGEGLPVMPLALRGAGCVPVDLEATYTEARARCRL